MTPKQLEKRIQEANRDGETSLDLDGKELTRLPESLGQLAQLQRLLLRDNQLTKLPESLGQLAQLQYLDLSRNQLKKLPESLGQLAQLRELRIPDNQLTKLPESLGQLVQLPEQRILDYRLTNPRESLDQLVQLPEQRIRNYRLTNLPESLGQFTQLRELRIPDYQLTKQPESRGQRAQLEYLDLVRNQLTQLPESLGQLEQLKMLFLHDNQLTQLPESLGQLARLQMLHLSRNQLTKLPESLGQLAELRDLSLSRNQLTHLPESLGQLVKLQYLTLAGNQLTQLPQCLLELARRGSLRGLFLHGNDALGLPAEVLGPPWEECNVYGGPKEAARPVDILEYYFRHPPPARGGAKGSSPVPSPSPDRPKLEVFLCHASPDKQRVREVYRWLKENGFEPWLDAEKLDPGDNWREEITMAVERSHIVLACLSKLSVSKEGFVQKEIKIALDVADEKPEGTIYIIPVKLEECDIPRRLRTWQWLNLFEPDGYERLARSLRKRQEKLGM